METRKQSNRTEADGRPSNGELTPEADDMNYAIPTPPPLKAEHVMNSPPPQPNHAGQMHSGAGGRGRVAGGDVGAGGGGSAGNGSATPPPPKESSPQQVLCPHRTHSTCWTNYDSNIVTMFSKLRNLEHFVDVTLWCEGRTIKCHKMILSACSTYFETLLTEMPNLHPIIFLKDMRFWEIQALVEFMYKGEVSIHQEKLQSLLRAAESLQIKGLGSPSNEIGGGSGGSSNGSGNEQGNNNNNNNGNASEQQGGPQSNSSAETPSSQNLLHNHLLPHHNMSAEHTALSRVHHTRHQSHQQRNNPKQRGGPAHQSESAQSHVQPQHVHRSVEPRIRRGSQPPQHAPLLLLPPIWSAQQAAEEGDAEAHRHPSSKSPHRQLRLSHPPTR